MKVGLKETLSLLAAGYKKKDIEAMIAAEEEEDKKEAEAQAQPEAPEDKKAPDDADAKESNPEPFYKKMLEEKQKELEEIQAKLNKIQQDNVHKDSAPAAEEAAKVQQESLTNLVRSFM